MSGPPPPSPPPPPPPPPPQRRLNENEDEAEEEAEAEGVDLYGLHDRIQAELARHAAALSAIYQASPEEEVGSSSSTSPMPAPCGDAGVGEVAGFLYATAGSDDLSLLLDSSTGEAAPSREDAQQGSTAQLEDSRPAAAGAAVEDDDDERLEKRIFVRAALQLLVERTASGSTAAIAGGATLTAARMLMGSTVESAASSLSSSLFLSRSARARGPGEEAGRAAAASAEGASKAGYLRKATLHSVGATTWRVKWVEVHPGLLIYIDDDALLGNRKKSLPLHTGVCEVRPVSSTSHGANVFSLELASRKRRLWMCASEDDRNEWTRAIAEAMVPVALVRAGGLAAGPYAPALQGDMLSYLDAKAALVASDDRESYLHALGLLGGRVCVPFPWVRAQIVAGRTETPAASSTSHKHSRPLPPDAPDPPGQQLRQLWKDVARDRFSIQAAGMSSRDFSGGEPEDVLASLARAIVLLASRSHGVDLTEVQAVSHTLAILTACNRTQSGGDTYSTIEHLLGRQDLVVVCPFSSQAEPLLISLELLPDGRDRECASPKPKEGQALLPRPGPACPDARPSSLTSSSGRSRGSGTGGGSGSVSVKPSPAVAAATPATILVRVQADTVYKVCPVDPQEDDGSELWATVAARYEQQFTISASGLNKSHELIRLRVAAEGQGRNGGGDGDAGDQGPADAAA